MSKPQSIVVITGSPTRPSRTAALAGLVAERLANDGFRIHTLSVRDLPAEALMHARFDDPQIVAAQRELEQADGVIVATPVFKAAYAGLLKCFLDLLPQFGLRGKVVLPLLTGGTLAHVLALDYALRPVLQSLDPRLVVAGLFVLDKWIELAVDGEVKRETDPKLDADVVPRLETVVSVFVDALRGRPV
jgi:FMN reductase